MKKAFTLVELLVVATIIAILTSITLVEFGVAKSKSRDSKRVADVAQIQLAIQLYFNRCNQYPNMSGSNGVTSVDINSSVGCPTGISMNSFLNQIPTPPSGDYGSTAYTLYRYHVHTTNGVNDNYYLMAKLENPTNNVFDNSITGMIPAGGVNGWAGLTQQFEVGKNALYYAVGPK